MVSYSATLDPDHAVLKGQAFRFGVPVVLTQINRWIGPGWEHFKPTAECGRGLLMPKTVQHTDAQVDQAMNTVLEKERQSRLRVEQCEREALALLDEAERHARAIADRTDKRITSIRRRCGQATECAVNELLDEDRERSEFSPESARESARVDSAVRRLAVILTGDADDDAAESTPP